MNEKSFDGAGTLIVGICVALAIFIFLVSSAAPVQAAEQANSQPSTSQVEG